MDPRHKAEIDRLTELASVGAEQAAAAFGQLVDRDIYTGVPTLVEGGIRGLVNTPHQGSDRVPDASWCTGVFFEFEGCLNALVGILFPGAASEALVRRILGVESGELSRSLIESALMEVGNILASHVASSIADTLQARLLPSIPTLAMDNAESALGVWIEERVGPDVVRIECPLHDESGELHGRLILVPTESLD